MSDSLDAMPGLRPLEAGRVFAGRFRIVRALGHGGMGSVYEAVQVALDRTVALKLLHPALCMDVSLVQRFQREAKLMAALRHPNIVEVIDAGVDDGVLWIAMELLRGESLGHWLERRGDRASPSELLPRLAPVARALSHMHARSIVHRDVKPDNVMLSRTEAGDEVPKLLDLGIATAPADGAKLTATGSLLGTPAYIAPEQALGGADITPAADQWAFAAMLYEAFTGHLPHASATPMGIITQRVAGPPTRPEALVERFDSALSDVLMRALAPSPGDRFASMDALLDALAPFADMDRDALSGASPPSTLAPQEPSAPGSYATPAGLSLPARPSPIAPASAPTAIAPADAPASPAPRPPSRVWAMVPWLVAAVVVVATIAALPSRSARSPERDAGSRAAEGGADVSPAEVTFALDFSPSTARISLENNVIGAGHASLRVPRDGRAYALRVEAEGHLPYRDVIRATGDVQISRTLVPRDGGVPGRESAPRVAPPPPRVNAQDPAPPRTTTIPQRRPIDQSWTP